MFFKQVDIDVSTDIWLTTYSKRTVLSGVVWRCHINGQINDLKNIVYILQSEQLWLNFLDHALFLLETILHHGRSLQARFRLFAMRNWATTLEKLLYVLTLYVSTKYPND